MKKIEQGSPGMDRAAKILEQAKARYEEEKRKANAKRRKAENHHKYMVGGIIVKYFPDCYKYEESELIEILSAALSTRECKAAIARVRKAADMDEGHDGSGYADDEKAESGGYADSHEKNSIGGGSYGQKM